MPRSEHTKNLDIDVALALKQLGFRSVSLDELSLEIGEDDREFLPGVSGRKNWYRRNERLRITYAADGDGGFWILPNSVDLSDIPSLEHVTIG